MNPDLHAVVDILDSDTESLLRDAMRQRGQSFKQALNDAVRRGLSGVVSDLERSPFTQRTFPMRLRAGYDVGKLSDLETELGADEFLALNRRLMHERSDAK